MAFPWWLFKLLAGEASSQGAASQAQTAEALGTGVEANKASQWLGTALSGLSLGGAKEAAGSVAENVAKEGFKASLEQGAALKDVGTAARSMSGMGENLAQALQTGTSLAEIPTDLSAIAEASIKMRELSKASNLNSLTDSAQKALAEKLDPEKWNLAKGIGDTIWGFSRGLIKEALFMPINPKEQIWADYVGSFIPKVAKVRGGAPFGTQIYAQNQRMDMASPENAMKTWLLKQQLAGQKDVTPLQAANLIKDPFAKTQLSPKVYEYLKKRAELMGQADNSFMGNYQPAPAIDTDWEDTNF